MIKTIWFWLVTLLWGKLMCISWESDKIVSSIFLPIKCMKVSGKIYFINNIIWIRKYKYGIYVIYNNINFSTSLMNNTERDNAPFDSINQWAVFFQINLLHLYVSCIFVWIFPHRAGFRIVESRVWIKVIQVLKAKVKNNSTYSCWKISKDWTKSKIYAIQWRSTTS